MEHGEAGASLDVVRDTNIRLAAISHWSFGRHAAYGALLAMIVFAIALPDVWFTAGIALTMVMLALLIAQDKRRDGMFVSGLSGRRPRAALMVSIAILLGSLGIVFAFRDAGPFSLPVICATVFTLVGCTLASLWWERLYRAELLEAQP